MSEYLDKDGLVLYNEKVEKALNKKQDALIPGDGITIGADGKTISASGSSIDFATPQDIEDYWTVYKKVDLGLPGRVLWSSCNIGANNPTQYGMYFLWGTTEGDYDGSHATGTHPFGNNYDEIKSIAFPSDVLLPNYDAASVILGNGWRMPTKQEFKDLLSDVYTTKTIEDDYIKITSRINGNSIILPYAGSAAFNSITPGTRALYLTSSYMWSNQCLMFKCDKGVLPKDRDVVEWYWTTAGTIRPVHD